MGRIFKKFSFMHLIPNLFFLGGVIVFGIIVVSYSKDFIQTRQVDNEIVKLEEDIAMIQKRNVELSELIKYFDSDMYTEKKARMELGLKKPEESVVVIPHEETSVRDQKQKKEEEKNLPNIIKWWRYFFL